MFGGNKKPPYPLGFMRNVARLYLRTPHQISLDTDIIPSPDLAFVYERAMNTYKERNPGVDMGTVMFVPPGELVINSRTSQVFLPSNASAFL
jgi:hypothetical protein